MRVCLIRPSADFAGDVRYSGGIHGFRCIAETLAAAGHDVHVLYCSSKAQLVYEALMQGCMLQLNYSPTVEGVAVWKEHNVTHHVGLTDVEQSMQDELSTAFASMGGSSTGPSLPAVIQRLMDELKSLTNFRSSSNSSSQQQQSWVLLDADGSQEALSTGAPSLFEACMHHIDPKKVLLLVQNIHFLPLGPAGSAARSPGLLAAWGAVGGVICVSNFVANYIAQHAGPLGLQPQRITVVHYATWHAFGHGPFLDLASAQPAVSQLPWQQHGSSSGADRRQHSPIIGCLKLTPEKGGQLFLALAQQMPQFNFLAVCSDPGLQQQAAGMQNVRLIPPAADVASVLQHMNTLLAPSLWQEAYGMVVTQGLVHGIPVIVSDQGGLADAALGAAAAVVPVNPMVLPVDPSTGSPSWKQRLLPGAAEQPLSRWADAVQQLLSSREVYEECSRVGRSAALQLLEQQPQLLQQFEGWLEQL